MTSRNPETWMWQDACEFLERAERLQRQFFQLGRVRQRRPSWEPPIDIVETADELRIQVALPGVDAEHIQVALDDGGLVVSGEHPLALNADTLIHRMEIPHGHFERRIELPAGRLEVGPRELINGCLLVNLRKLA